MNLIQFKFSGVSVNRNNIIMISKGYHYVINIALASKIYISKSLFILDPCQKTYCSGWTQAILGSPFFIDPEAHYPRWVSTGHNWNSIYKVFSFYFWHSSPFYLQYNQSLQILFNFHFPHFCFLYNFVVLQRNTPLTAVLCC